MTFKELNLNENILEGLLAMGYKVPSPIQEKAIPVIMDNKDLVACAQTGTGKTAAYLLPILQNILENESRDKINTLILAPTRELALQIDQQLEGLSYFLNISSIPIYGGTDGNSFDQQKKALKEGADVIIATPGKMISHLNLGYADFSHLQHLVLDEADRMLDMGFYDDIMKIVNFLPKKRQTLLFSATMPPKIRELASKILLEPQEISLAISKPAERVQQGAFMTYDHQKIPLVKKIIAGKNIPSVIIFSSTKQNVKSLERDLRKEGLSVAAIHSDLEQSERESVLNRFRDKQVQILVATDIVARGIDIESISLVLNFDVPHDAEDYIHRIGRTARAASKGVAITLVNEKEQKKFSKIEDFLGNLVPKYKIPEELGAAPVYLPEKSYYKAGSKAVTFKKNFKTKRDPK